MLKNLLNYCTIETMTKRKDLNKQYPLPKWFWATIVAIAAVILLSVGYFLYWQTGWPSYLSALDRCGHKPPVEASSFIASTYINPGDDSYRIPGEKGYTTYFCTESDAILSRYKHIE